MRVTVDTSVWSLALKRDKQESYTTDKDFELLSKHKQIVLHKAD